MRRLLLLLSTLYILCPWCADRLVAAPKSFVVVIDAGHGGKDPGARRGKIMEKDITLGVALRLGELLRANQPGIKVLFTRSTDRFVGLQERADFANSHRASLFLSIHVNSASGSVSGTETYVLGLEKQQNNFNVALRENKVIELEDNYKTIYRGYNPNSAESLIAFKLQQEAYQDRSIELARLVEGQYRQEGRRSRGVRQGPFWVLSQSAMPSILTEVGFLSNDSEADFLNSKAGQSSIASALYRAVVKFYQSSTGLPVKVSTPQQTEALAHDTIEAGVESISQERPGDVTPAKGRTANKSQAKGGKKTSKGLVYRVQFMSVPDKIDTSDRQFKRLGLPVYRTKYGNGYRYMAGRTDDLDEARSMRGRVRRFYRDAFIVSFDSAGNYIGMVAP